MNLICSFLINNLIIFVFFSGSYPWAEQTLLLNCNQLQEKRAWGENVVELAQKEMDWWTNFEEVWHTLENQRADCPGVYSSFHQLYGDNFSSVGAWDLIIIFLVTYYPQCRLSCPGNAEPSHQVQQGSARGGWAATWETCHSECGSAGCKEAFGRACVEFDVVKHSSDPRNHAWHGCLLAYSYCCSKQSTHTHFIEAPDTWMSLTPDTFWFYCLFMNALFCSMLLLNFLLFFSIKALGYSNYV